MKKQKRKVWVDFTWLNDHGMGVPEEDAWKLLKPGEAVFDDEDLDRLLDQRAQELDRE